MPLTKWLRRRAFCNSVLIGLWQERELKRTTTFVRLEDDSEIPEDVIAELEEVSAGLTLAIPWQAGDTAIVDNARMLHGRREFTDDQREVYARMCRSVDW